MSCTRLVGWAALALVFSSVTTIVPGCGSSGANGARGPDGGATSTGGSGAAGANAGTGGASATGGADGTAGAAGAGGSPMSGSGGAAPVGSGGAIGTVGTGGAAGAAGGATGASGGATGGGAGGGTGLTGGGGGGGTNPGTGGRGGAGGTTGSGGAAGAGPLNPPVGMYATRANLLASTSEMAVGEAAGKIYVIGGYPTNPAASVTTVAVYTPSTNSWATTTPYPFALHHPVVIGVAGKLYSLGGQTPTADTARSFEFDPGTSNWRELAPMPTARGAGAAAAVGDKIYVVGGRPPAANQLEVYDISDNAWMQLPPLPQAFPQRNHLSAVAIAGKIYVAGGRFNGGSFSSPRTAALDIFDPVAGSWSSGANMPDPPRGGINGVAAYGCFHIWGGEGTNTGFPNDVFPQHDLYNPRTNMWTRLPPLPTPVHGVTGAAFLDGIIYMPGGGTMSGGSSGSRIFQVFRPDPAVTCQ